MDEAKLKIIDENPIGDGLDAFRNEFASICDSMGLVCSPDEFDRLEDSWQYPERDEEGLLVKEATEMGVVNVARYYHHETVHISGVEDEIRTLIRKGLDTVAATADTAGTTAGTQATADTTAIVATSAISDTVDTIAATATSTMSAITAMARRRSISSSASLTPMVAAAAMSSS